MKLIITDSNLGATDLEQSIAERYGFTIAMPKQCRTEEDVIAVASDADGLIVQYAPVSRKVIESLPRLKVVSEYGVGVDSIDIEACTEHGVVVCNVPDYSFQEVSDHAVALTLALDRGIVTLDRQVRNGKYGLAAVKPLRRIAGRVFGVVGLGRIARAAAQKARGVGYRVIGTDIAIRPGTTTDDGITVVSFDELLSQSDVVSVHVPLTAGTKHLINAAALAKMKPDAVLINTARGGVVDTDALIGALKDKTIRGAALDVFETEPLPGDHPLTALENVILTPHAGYYSEESLYELKTRPVENAAEALIGGKPRYRVN
ncbi:MAG: C-terminal binding protein [Tannerella sp.]|jgi:D-3-phosphoglycerate dehydrogenase|nr:C-terminal binding protein [Tannerella sp.]